MGATKHEKSFVDFEKPYEQNIIGLKGIVYFAVGIVLLILITFGLMWALMNVLEDGVQATKGPNNPMRMSEMERLPPEPRLQSAPGFKVESANGPVNLELREPQAEYRELHKQWEEIWKNGVKDPKTGVMTSMPINMAKSRVLQQNLKARSGADAEAAHKESRLIISDSSSGRMPSEKRR